MRLGVLLSLLVWSACTSGQQLAPVSDSPADRCRIPASGATVTDIDTFTVVLSHRVDLAHAPRPTNLSERVAFAQLYQTLINIDCDGVVRAGLATSWRREDGGRIWRFTLRNDARFWDGTPVTAADVRRSWSRTEAVEPSAVSLGAIGDLVVHLNVPQATVPRLFADPEFAVWRSQPVGRWRLGTGAYRPGQPDASGSFVIQHGRDPGFVVVVRQVHDEAVRDVLDTGIDLLIAHDAANLEYAERHPRYQTVDLGWILAYVLWQPGRDQVADVFPRQFRDALARDAVRSEARASAPPHWWRAERCRVFAQSDAADISPSKVVAYRAGDRVGRDLAERLVAVSRSQQVPWTVRTDLRARPMTDREWGESLLRRDAHSYVLAVPRRVLDACGHWARTFIGPGTAHTLVDVRGAVVRSEAMFELFVTWDGTVVFGAR